MTLTNEGFRSEYGSADTFRFPQALRQWKCLSTSETSQTVATGEFAGNPSKLRQDLTSLGFAAYFPKGIRLSLRSTSGPILTWSEGSMEANTGYATPDSSWVLVSFRDAQPPVLFSFQGVKAGLKITGQTGQWTIASDDAFQGWVRISPPLGNKPFATNSAAELGKLAAACAPVIQLVSDQAPAVVSTQATDEGPGVYVEWKYDRPGAVVPFPVFLSAMGGYSVQPVSKMRRLDVNTSAGPVFVTDEPRLALRLPIRRVPTGRAVLVGVASGESIGTASHLDYAAVSELALSNLISTQDRGSRELAQSTVGEFVTEATYSVEPNTGQRLPFDGNGGGLDLAAAHALLLQSSLSTTKPTSEPNSLLTSLLWRRDWATWTLSCPDEAIRRRAGALASLAAALAPEPERRADAAMLHAGLAAERGLQVWLARTQGGPSPRKLRETFYDLRADLMGPDDYRRKAGFGRAILSELRSFGDVPVTLVDIQGRRFLRWQAPDARLQVITFASAYPLAVTAGKNVAEIDVSQGLGFTVIRCRPKEAGICEAELTIPSWAEPIPAWVAPPRFDEVER